MNETKKRMQTVNLSTKKCKFITCVYCAGGYCDMNENECHFIEKDSIED